MGSHEVAEAAAGAAAEPSVGLLIGLAVVVGVVLAVVFRVLEFAWVEMSRRGKLRVVWWDQDARKVRVEFRAVKDGKITVGSGENGRTYIVQGDCVNTGEYPTVAIHPEHGWNFRAPTNAETIDRDVKAAVLSVSNPKSYHKALARYEWSDTLNANDEKPNLWAKNAPVLAMAAVIVVLCIFGTLGFIAYKVTSASGGA